MDMIKINAKRIESGSIEEEKGTSANSQKKHLNQNKTRSKTYSKESGQIISGMSKAISGPSSSAISPKNSSNIDPGL